MTLKDEVGLWFLKGVEWHVFIQGLFIEQLLCFSILGAMDTVINEKV